MDNETDTYISADAIKELIYKLSNEMHHSDNDEVFKIGFFKAFTLLSLEIAREIKASEEREAFDLASWEPTDYEEH